MKFFVNTGDGIEFCDTAEEASGRAQKAIDGWRDCCDPEWPEEVSDVCWGQVLGQSVEVDVEGKYVDYKLEQSPAADTVPEADVAVTSPRKTRVCDYAGYACQCVGYKQAAAGSSLCVCGHAKSQHQQGVSSAAMYADLDFENGGPVHDLNCCNCKDTTGWIAWRDAHAKGWRKFYTSWALYTICPACRRDDADESQPASEESGNK